MRSYSRFLQLFVYYMCSRCEVAAPDHERQPDDGSGRHAHNGEMLQLLQPHPPNLDRISSAYIGYRSVDDGPATLRAIANGYNRPANPQHIERKLTELGEAHTYTALLRIESNPGVWLRHGLEHVQHADYCNGAEFPPHISRYNVGEMTSAAEYANGYFAIDTDTPPFTGCSVHWVDDHCGMPWSYVAGYIPLNTFLKLNGSLYNSTDRDHYYAQTQKPIPAEQWTYIYNDIPKQAIQRKSQQAALDQLLNSTLPRIQHSTLQQYHRLKTLLNIHSTVRYHVRPYKAAKR